MKLTVSKVILPTVLVILPTHINPQNQYTIKHVLYSSWIPSNGAEKEDKALQVASFSFIFVKNSLHQMRDCVACIIIIIIIIIKLMGRAAQRLTTGWMARDRIPVRTRFSARPDRPWGLPSLLYNGYRVFPGGKVRPGRAADHSPPSSAAVM